MKVAFVTRCGNWTHKTVGGFRSVSDAEGFVNRVNSLYRENGCNERIEILSVNPNEDFVGLT